ncbi:MAG TPA: serine hydrolase domain-containing protein [bacterium]|nr:serine hydrolase domain-containing protein [bacterium]
MLPSTSVAQADAKGLDERLAVIASMPGMELSGLVVSVIRDDGVIHEAAFGRSHIDAAHPMRDKPIAPDTMYRVASLSKPVAALVAMSLVEEGRLDLDSDVSGYLGFRLRNPAFAEAPISCAMLLAHTSSIRDGTSYTMPLGGTLEDFFVQAGRGWDDGSHFDGQHAPGTYFSYCNLGFGVLATVLEAIAGERYDMLARRRILGPLGMESSHNVNLLTDDAFLRLAPPYRTGPAESCRTGCPWIAQVDDYRGARPTLPCPALPGMTPADLDLYEPGTNGTLFSPQGGLRASVRDLSRLAQCLLGEGSINGRRIVSPSSLVRMMTPAWSHIPGTPDGDCGNGPIRETGLGLVHTTDSFDGLGGDRLLPGGGPRLWGHHADAYGLLGGMLLDEQRHNGFVYLIAGAEVDPQQHRGTHSSYFLWSELVQESVLHFLGQ